MNVKYNTVLFERTAAVSYYSVNDRLAFMQDILNKIVELSGVSLGIYSQTAASNSRASTEFVIKDNQSGNAILYMYMNSTTNSVPNCGYMYITPVSNSSPTEYKYYTDYQTAAAYSTTQMRLYMHYLKAGDLFVFGFARGDKTAGYYGWMNMALAPVRSFSNPEQIVGYTFVQINHNSLTVNDLARNNILCSQFYDASKEDLEEYSYDEDTIMANYLPGHRCSTVILIPVMMNSADYYLDGVYLCNKLGTSDTETAIKTTDGIYLLASTYNTSPQTQKRWSANLVFDITSVAEEAL